MAVNNREAWRTQAEAWVKRDDIKSLSDHWSPAEMARLRRLIRMGAVGVIVTTSQECPTSAGDLRGLIERENHSYLRMLKDNENTKEVA